MAKSSRKIILHVGLPKTGTTALQKWFRENRSRLNNSGIDYPDMHPPHEDKHSFIVGELQKTAPLTTFENILASTTCASILFSNEGMSNHFHDFPSENLQKFRSLTSEFEKSVVLLSRPAEQWIKSYHKQCVLNPNNGASDLWGTSLRASEITHHPRVLRLLDCDTLLQNMQAEYGATDIHHIRFGEEAWQEKVMQAIGLPARDINLPIINESVPDWAIEFLRQNNGMTSEAKERQFWRSAVQKHLQSTHTILTGVKMSEIDSQILEMYFVRFTQIDRSEIPDLSALEEFEQNLRNSLSH